MSETQANPAPAADPAEAMTLDQRVASMHDTLREAESAADGSEASSPPAAPPSTAESAPATGAPNQEALDRKARLDELYAKQRQQVDHKAKLAEQDQIRQRLAAAERQLAEERARSTKLIDVDSLDADGILSLLERGKATPQQIAERIRERIASPETYAAEAARRAVTPEVAALKTELAQLRQQQAQWVHHQQQLAAQAAEEQAARHLVSLVPNAGAPRSAAFMQHFGADEFLKIANSAAQALPEGAGYQAVIDVVEQQLDELARVYGPPGNPSQASATTPQNGAAAKAKTVTNQAAQERASVVDEDEWSSLPFEERVRRLSGGSR